MSRYRRASQLVAQLGSQLQQARGVKASTTKLPVVLIKDVEGLGGAGKQTSVNHGYARNFLIPRRLVQVDRKAGAAAGAVASRGGAAKRGNSEEEEARQCKEAAQQRRQIEMLIKKLTGAPLTLKRRTQSGGQTLEQEIGAKDITDAVAKQLRIEMVPELLDLQAGDTLKVVGEYRLPMKLVLPSGERAVLDVNVVST